MESMSPIKFGTDGWRGLIARDFTFDNLTICAAAYSRYLKQTNLAKKGVIIGYDTRFLSDEFARETAEVMTAAGIHVTLSSSAVPTPVVSYGTLNRKSGGAVVITASHNPAQWNGFKVKSPTGSSSPTEVVTSIEKHVQDIVSAGIKPEKLSLEHAANKGLFEYADLMPPYIEQLSRLVDIENLRRGMTKIVVDSMHGAGAGLFQRLLGDNYPLIEIKREPNPAFPGMQQPEPIDMNLKELKERVTAEAATVGLATDGDADRLGAVDEKGNFLTQLQVISLLALYLLEVRGQRGAIVKTITSSGMLYKLGELYNIPVYETPVGFKYVAPVMERENAILGGEESGGYGFKDHVLERDAMVAGLYLLDLIARTHKKPSELLASLYDKVGPHHYHRIDVAFNEAERDKVIGLLKAANPGIIDGSKVKKDTLDGFRFTFEDGSWLLIRTSGTEPLLRMYAESDSIERVSRLLDAGRKIAGV